MKKEVFEHYKMACANNRQICCADVIPAFSDEKGLEGSYTEMDRWEKENRHLICYKCSKEPANV